MQILSGIGFLIRVAVLSAVLGFLLGLYVSHRVQPEAEPRRETTPALTLGQLDSSAPESPPRTRWDEPGR